MQPYFEQPELPGAEELGSAALEAGNQTPAGAVVWLTTVVISWVLCIGFWGGGVELSRGRQCCTTCVVSAAAEGWLRLFVGELRAGEVPVPLCERKAIRSITEHPLRVVGVYL